MDLIIKRFEELTTHELYEILRARAAVFVVEQRCAYQDIDRLDADAYHVFYREDNQIQAYLRVIEKGMAPHEAAIGRVLTIKRGQGLGEKLMLEGIRVAKEKTRAAHVLLEAQSYAKGFYEKFGFIQTSDEFLLDNIPHVRMILNHV